MTAIRAVLAVVLIVVLVAGPLAVQAQNVAVVNGKPVPKARVDALMAQITKQASARGQQLPPDFDKLGPVAIRSGLCLIEARLCSDASLHERARAFEFRL